MKTPYELEQEALNTPGFLTSDYRIAWEFIEAIQKDALSDPMAQTLDQHELEMVKDIAENLEYQLQVRTQELAEMREKWHEARKHLRAANKGAERNAQALELSATRFWEMVHSDRRWKERDENQHKTIIWNWLLMSDDEYRLKCGELSSQDLRNIRAVLKAMLGTSLIKHL
jgi:hypothetical protein